MTITELEQRIAASIAADFAAYRAANTPATVRTVRAGEDLQAVLNQGGALQLEAGATFAGNFTITAPCNLTATGAALIGSGGPALSIRASDVTVTGGTYGTSGYNSVVRLGLNTTEQNSLELVPRRITLTGLSIPTFRGTAGFEINAADVLLDGCEARDVWDPAGGDSKAVFVMNTPGNVTIRGGYYEAGSEIVMVGGDTMKIPNVYPTYILLDGPVLERPMAWRTDGVNRKVKNLIELKTGINVTIRNVVGRNCWRGATAGFAILLTPASGGYIQDVLVEDCQFSEVASAIQMTGLNDDSITPQPTRGIVFRRTRFDVNKELGFATSTSGYGRFLQVQQEAEDFTAEDCICTGVVGTSQIHGSRATVMELDGVRRTGAPMRRLVLNRNYIACGRYGINLDGGANGSLATQYVTELLDVSGNTFGGAASAMRTNFPNNQFMDRATFDATLP